VLNDLYATILPGQTEETVISWLVVKH
jgi:hypothetical protein